MKSELSQDESGSESEELQHSDVEEGEEHTHEDCDEDMVRDVWTEAGEMRNVNDIVRSEDQRL